MLTVAAPTRDAHQKQSQRTPQSNPDPAHLWLVFPSANLVKKPLLDFLNPNTAGLHKPFDKLWVSLTLDQIDAQEVVLLLVV